MIRLPDLTDEAFLAPLGPVDRSPLRVGVMATGGLALAFMAGMAATFLVLEAARALGIDLTTEGAGYPEPTLVRSGLYVLEISLALGASALALLLVARRLFHRPLASWITTAPRFRWGQVGLGLVIGLVGLTAVSQIPGLGAAGELLTDAPILDPTASIGVRLFYVAATGFGFLIAAAAEEAVFRGYVLQQVTALTRHPLSGLMISGVLFALIHLEFSPYALAARTVIGLAFAWTALRLGGLEFAIGAHLANNLVIALFGEAMLPGVVADQGDALGVVTEVIIAVFLAVAAEVIRGRAAARPA